MVPEIFVKFSFPPPAIFSQVLSRSKVFWASRVISSAPVWKPVTLHGSLEYIELRMGRRGYPRRWAFRKRASISQATTSSSGFHYFYNQSTYTNFPSTSPIHPQCIHNVSGGHGCDGTRFNGIHNKFAAFPPSYAPLGLGFIWLD